MNNAMSYISGYLRQRVDIILKPKYAMGNHISAYFWLSESIKKLGSILGGLFILKSLPSMAEKSGLLLIKTMTA